MKRTTLYIPLLILFSFWKTICVAQTFKADVDRDKILIGEQIHVTFRVEGLRAAQNFVRNWVALPDTFNHFEVTERGKIDTIEVNRDVIYQQNITLTSFDSGQWQIPAFIIGVTNNQNNQTVNLTTQPIVVNVLPVDVSQLQDYHDIKDIVKVDNSNVSWILIAIAAVTLLSLVIIYIRSQRKKRLTVKAPVLAGASPIHWANKALDELEQQDLPGKGQVKQYYNQLVLICRQFFELQLQQKTLHLTTDEWMLQLQSLPLSVDTKTAFFQTMRMADSVKFARFVPSINEQYESMGAARKMIVETDQLKYANLNPQKPLVSA